MPCQLETEPNNEITLTNGLLQIPYKQSGVQLTELLETACSKPADYFQTKGDNPKTKVYKRQNRRDGKPSALKSVTINKDINKMLKFAVSHNIKLYATLKPNIYSHDRFIPFIALKC